MIDLSTVLGYVYFIICFILGWIAAAALDYDGILRRSTSHRATFLLRLGIALVLAEGFRIFLSYAVGPLLDFLVNNSVKGFRTF